MHKISLICGRPMKFGLYHSGNIPEVKKSRLRQWQSGELHVLVATNGKALYWWCILILSPYSIVTWC